MWEKKRAFGDVSDDFRQRDRRIPEHRGEEIAVGPRPTDLARSREFGLKSGPPAAPDTANGPLPGRIPWLPDRLLEEYLATLSQDSEEVRLLERVPWIVGTHRQDHVHILEGLRAEASRFAELPDGPRFSLLTPLWNTPPRLLDELILSVRCQSCPAGS